MTVIIISQCIHISKYHLVYLRDKQCLFVNYTSIKPGKISAFQLHDSHWWCLQDLSLGKDVDLSLYPVSSLVHKLVLVIQFPLPVIETTHPLEMGLGHIFCHFSPQNAYSQNKRHTGRNSCLPADCCGVGMRLLALWHPSCVYETLCWDPCRSCERMQRTLASSSPKSCSPQNFLLCEIKHFYYGLNWLGMKFSVTVSCMHLRSSTIFKMFMKNVLFMKSR